MMAKQDFTRFSSLLLYKWKKTGPGPEFQSKGPILSLSYSTEIAIIQPKYTIKPTRKCVLYV